MVATRPVRVTFRKKELQDLNHDVHWNNRVITSLREAGIPVAGGIWLRGVEHGRLTMFNQGALAVYEWVPGEDSDEEEL